MTELRAVLFDFNGVIADDEPLHQRAMAEVLPGEPLTPEEYFEHALGLPDRPALARLLARRGRRAEARELDALVQRKAAAYAALLGEGAPLCDGAAELVRSLAGALPLAVVSGAFRHEVELVLGRAGLAGCFRAVVTAEDVRRGKPDPEGLLLALGLLRRSDPGLAAAGCVVVEDSPAGLRAARAAGMTAVGVTHSRPAAELTPADQVVTSLRELSLESLQSLVAFAQRATTS